MSDFHKSQLRSKFFRDRAAAKNIQPTFSLPFFGARKVLLLLEKARNLANKQLPAYLNQLIRSDKPIYTGFLVSKIQYFCLINTGL